MKKILLLLLLPGFLTACDALIGEEVARLPINAISGNGKVVMQEDALHLEAGEKIAFWADMDMAFDTLPEVLFRMEIQLEGVPLGIRLMDPTQASVKLNEVRTAMGGEETWRFSGKMGEMKADQAGTYRFRVMLIGSDSPRFVLKQAELVIRK